MGISPIRLSPIGHSPMAKVHCTFANWRNSRGCIGESVVDFRQLAKFEECIGESTVDFRQLSRNNINIGGMPELKLILLEYISDSLHSSM